MRTRLRAIVIIAGLVVAAMAVLGWQHRTAERLRAERDRQQAALARLKADRRTKQKEQELASAHARAEELDRLLAERAAVTRLRAELETLRHRAAAVHEERAPATVRSGLTGGALAFSLWQNAGRVTPEATLETALWAAANGDIDTLTDLLVFDGEAHHEATTLFSQLPASLRQEFVSPERLVAALAAKDVPLGSAALLNQYPTPTETKLSVQMFDAEGKHKMALLSVRPDAAGWRFVVPVNAVKRYADWLHAPPSIALAPVAIGGSSR
ncbi:MAG TPA: hypothetical protein VIM71_02630 [Lacunisphaera sp.]